MRILSQALKEGLVMDIPEHLATLQGATALEGLRPSLEGMKRQEGLLAVPYEWQMELNGFLYWPYSSPACYVAAGATEIHTYDGDQERDVSSGSYASTDVWDIIQFHNRVIFNNGSSAPQYWHGDSPSTTLTALPNWPSGLVCKTLRAFRRYLVALQAGSPMTVRWSTPADPGSVPSSWAIDDPTKDSGEVVLDLEGGQLFELVPMRDAAILYASNSVWRMEHIGGVFVFRFQKISEIGVYGKRQAVEYQAGLHLVFGNRDILVFDGMQFKSVATGRVQRFLSLLDDAELRAVWLTVREDLKEVWIMLPSRGIALTWAWELNAFGVVRMPGVTWIGASGGLESSAFWSNFEEAWDTNVDKWMRDIQSPMGIMAAKGKYLWTFSYSAMDDFPADFQHTGIKGDNNAVKTCYEIWPYFRGEKGTRVLVSVGARMNPDDEVVWREPVIFRIGDQRKVNTLISGRILALRVRSLDPKPWVFEGYELEVKPTGVY